MLQNSIICMYVVICQHHKNQLRPVEFFLFSHQSLHFLLKSINFDGFGNLFFWGGGSCNAMKRLAPNCHPEVEELTLILWLQGADFD